MRVIRIVTVVAAIMAVALGAAWLAARPAQPDAFYDIAGQAPGAAPGRLLRSDSFARDLPSGAEARRILYTTTRADGALVVASALVILPRGAAAASRDIVAWAHGTTGIARGCAPTLLSRPLAHTPAGAQALARGWAIVATDYVGLGSPGPHAYLIGEESARGVLDAVRAARADGGFGLGARVVVWGHSQGGHSALWAGMRAPLYAPELELRGVAALAPASDLPGLVAAARGSAFGKIVSSYMMSAYAATYPDVEAGAYLKSWARPLVADMAGRCVGGYETMVSVAQALALGDGVFARDPTIGPLGARLVANIPGEAIAAPVLIAQGDRDDLVTPGIQQRYVAARCAAGQAIDYRVYAGRDHLSLVASGSPLEGELVAWTADRFSGAPALQGCR